MKRHLVLIAAFMLLCVQLSAWYKYPVNKSNDKSSAAVKVAYL